MHAKITLKMIGGLKAGDKDKFIWDTELSGFGIKHTRVGSVIYIVQSRLSGKLKRYTIGRHGAPWTPDKARRQAIGFLGRIANGEDPGEAKRKRRHAPTVEQLCDLYLKEGCQLKKQIFIVHTNLSSSTSRNPYVLTAILQRVFCTPMLLIVCRFQ